jgi:hypothetical protein
MVSSYTILVHIFSLLVLNNLNLPTQRNKTTTTTTNHHCLVFFHDQQHLHIMIKMMIRLTQQPYPHNSSLCLQEKELHCTLGLFMYSGSGGYLTLNLHFFLYFSVQIRGYFMIRLSYLSTLRLVHEAEE